MTDYRTIKAELASDRSNVRYFTKAFYDLYIKCRAEVRRNAENGIDDLVPYTTESGTEITVHAPHIPIFSTDFYRKNGTTYCQFLTIMYGHEKEAC